MSQAPIPPIRQGDDRRLSELSTAGHDHLPEIRCRCDGGPHGSLRLASLAYAQPLSVEICYGGVDILAAPGTNCYDRRSRRPHAGAIAVTDHGDVVTWVAEHEGTRWPELPLRHCRSVLLDRASRIVDIVDQSDGDSGDIRPAFHFGPDIKVELVEFCAFLSWPNAATPGMARLEVPVGLNWSLQQTEADAAAPALGPGPGEDPSAFTLLGQGQWMAGVPLAARLVFADTEMLPNASYFQAVSWSVSGDCRGKPHGTQAGAT